MFFFFYLSFVFSDGEIRPGPTAGNYANENYVNLRKIDSSKFTAEANGGEYSNYPLSQAFDNDKNKYWVSNTPNSASFMNTITINFDKVTTLEAILMDTAYSTNRSVTPNTRAFWGYPTALNVYASTINNRYELVASFKGDQVYPTTRVQFVFPDAVECKKLRLDFVEVTNQSMTNTVVGPNPTIGELLLLRYAPTIETKSPVGDYSKEEYVSKNKIPRDDFTVVANGGEDSNFPLSNAFDGGATTYWASSQPNTDSFKNALTFDFGEPLSIEAFLMDTAYSTNRSVTPNTRAFWGYPTTLNVYTAKGNDDFQLAAVFVGTPVHPMTRIQFAFSTPISCSRLKLEYADITPQFLTNDKGTLKANIGELILIRNDDRIQIAGAAGNYNDAKYLTYRTILPGSYTLTSNGGNLNDNRKLEYGFDGKANTYHISGTPNSEDFMNTFTINFLEITTLEAFLYFPAYFSDGNGGRRFDGFPTTLKVYTTQDNGNDFELIATFAGTPAFPMEWIQFVFPTPITCKKIRLTFVEVTEVQYDKFVSSPAKYACIGDIKFVKYNEPLEIDGVSGKYANSAYISERKIPSNSFTTLSRSDSRNGYPLSNLYDDNKDTYWIAGQANNLRYDNYLEINFNQLVSLEAFLMDTAYKTDRTVIPNTRTYLGYPTILNVFVSTGNSYNPVATFSGTPVYPMERIQYVFLEPITCSKIKLEFDEVTFDSLKTNDYTPFLGSLIFLRSDIKPTSPPTPEIGEGDYTFSDSNCNNKNDHCDITISDEKYVNIIIAKTDFNGYETDENGGAIYLVNTGLKSGDSNSRITFTNCLSRNGGGGAIYIRNEFENIENKISINNNVFEGCSAVYGGSIYIYSKAVRCEINKCEFFNNKLIKSDAAQAPFNSGSAIFLTYRDGGFSALTFDGGDDHLIQIYNNFNTRPPSVLSEKDVVFEDCTFINSQNTKSSIYFIGGKYGSQYIVKNCHFKGKMQDGLYYIDGDAISKNARKLLVDSCDFESGAKMAFNTNSNIEFLQAHSKKKSSNVSSENIVPALAIFMMVAIAAVTLMIIKKNGNAVDNSSTHEETQELDHNYSLDQQLI